MPFPELQATLTDIGTEELGHLEMIGTIVYQLTKDLTEDQLKDLNTNTEVRLSFFAPNVINIGLSILCAVIIIILIIVLLIRHRKR